VIPVQNEAKHLGRVLTNVLSLPVDFVLPVVNGSSDNSRKIINAYPGRWIKMIHFEEPLGIDVPRAVGAFHARRLGAGAVLFVDGDMAGNIRPALEKLVRAVKNGADLSLADCYPAESSEWISPMVGRLLGFRRELNQALGLEHLGSASPSHGPHAVSRRFLETIPLRELGIPPVTSVLAVRQGLRIEIAASLPHCKLGSPDRGARHARWIAETIIGDHLEAFCVLENRKRSRSRDGVTYDGYHHTRRWDLLESIIGSSDHRLTWYADPPPRRHRKRRVLFWPGNRCR
jgi:glycosyltransferase involved in cell wall biosynthesis